MEMIKINNKGEAIETAIKWQKWASKRNLSYGELSQWQGFFERLAKKFKLQKEFKENGII